MSFLETLGHRSPTSRRRLLRGPSRPFQVGDFKLEALDFQLEALDFQLENGLVMASFMKPVAIACEVQFPVGKGCPQSTALQLEPSTGVERCVQIMATTCEVGFAVSDGSFQYVAFQLQPSASIQRDVECMTITRQIGFSIVQRSDHVSQVASQFRVVA